MTEYNHSTQPDHVCPKYENQICCLRHQRDHERERAVTMVMDLLYALRDINGAPTLKDLVKLAKRIKND